MKIINSYIILKDVRLYAYHGVSPQESCIGNEYLINLKLKTHIKQAIETDEITDTISYADVYKKVKEEMAIPSKLLEHISARIVQRLFKDFPEIEEIELKVMKRNPPMGADIKSAGIEMHCIR